MVTGFTTAPARLPDGLRIYAIGDIHGCLTRLVAIHEAISEDLQQRPVPSSILVHIGDYIDRGPDSAGVITYLSAADFPARPSETINLLGNHEDLFLAAYDQKTTEAFALWQMNGGRASLTSWGVVRSPFSPPWADRIPLAHAAFIRRLPLTHLIGPYLFVHAGIRPGVPLARQAREDLIWIREPFLRSDSDFGVIVVHGHTPREGPEVRGNRIGIDTGAVMGGALTCAVLEADRVGFIQR